MSTANISVKVHIEGIPGRDDFFLTLPLNSSIENLIESMEDLEEGTTLKHIRDPDSGEMRYFLVAVNGKMVRFPDAFREILRDGDEILFISPLVGG